jgi:hypothetical protein
MKQVHTLTLLVSALMLVACENGMSGSDSLSGSWSAALSDQNGTQALAFTTSLSQQSGSSSVIVNNLAFTTDSPCFSSGTTETGSFVISGNFSGQMKGTYQMAIQSEEQSRNLLTLVGAVNNNTVSGTWTLTGLTAGCTGTGNFTMKRL